MMPPKNGRKRYMRSRTGDEYSGLEHSSLRCDGRCSKWQNLRRHRKLGRINIQ